MRGMGSKQRDARLLTDAKIVYSLYYRPCTFQILWKLTRIQRSTLKSRLNYLKSHGMVLVCNYDTPIKRKDLANRFNRDWYLLNYASPEVKQLKHYYYENSPEFKTATLQRKPLREFDEKTRKRIEELQRFEEETFQEIKKADDQMKEKLDARAQVFRDYIDATGITPLQFLIWFYLYKDKTDMGYQMVAESLIRTGILKV